VSLRFGYGLNGFTDHRLPDALAVVAGLGYDGVALTLDHAHLDPFGPGLAGRVAEAARLLSGHGLDVMVETGGRYVLDPWRKHHPTLVSDEGRERRLKLLRIALRVAADLGSPAVSFWSGTGPEGVARETLLQRLDAGVEALLPLADELGVDLALEPEPGMVVERLQDAVDVRSRLGEPDRLRLTVDVGHLRCNEEGAPGDLIRSVGPLVRNVQIDDMRRGTHEHLPFGEGEVDLPGALAALQDIGFGGLVAVELPRHTHMAPALAAASLDALRAAERQTRPTDEEVTR
jgi:sugar phosphate isomerase/epimerase